MVDYFETYLRKNKFNKSFKKLKSIVKDKKVVIYGTGTLFQYINNYYNLRELNIIGVSDMKYSLKQEGEDDFGYKIIPKSSISKYKPDYVLVATENYFNIVEDLEMKYFINTNTSVLPLVPKSLLNLIKNIWDLV